MYKYTDKFRKSTTKILRWIMPPILLLLAIVTLGVVFAIGSLIIYPKTLAGDIGYGWLLFFAIWLLLLPIFPFLYSVTLLKDCKHRICYATYCSAFIVFSPMLLGIGNIIRDGISAYKDQIIYLAIIFIWCELGALLGLLRYRNAKE